MTQNTGKPSEKFFDDMLRCMGKHAFNYPFEDQAALVGRNKGKMLRSSAKPCDRLVVTRVGVTFCEVKSSHDKTAFRFSQFQIGQISYATTILAAGGRYCVYINRLPEKTWFCLPWSKIAEVMTAGRKSIRWSELSEFQIDQENPKNFTQALFN